MAIPPRLVDASDRCSVASLVGYVPSKSTHIDPKTALRLIEHAGEGMQRLEQWQEDVQAQVSMLLDQIWQEQTASSTEIESLNYKIDLLHRQLAEIDISIAKALSDKEHALNLLEKSESRTVNANQRAEAAEKRAQIAEDWLVYLQELISVEFDAQLCLSD